MAYFIIYVRKFHLVTTFQEYLRLSLAPFWERGTASDAFWLYVKLFQVNCLLFFLPWLSKGDPSVQQQLYNSGHRHSDQHAQKSEATTANNDGQDDKHWVKANTVANDSGRNNVTI